MHNRQCILPLKWNIISKPKDIIIAEHNSVAFDTLKQWPGNNQDNFLCIVGDKSSGKTTLASMWAKQVCADFIACDEDLLQRWYSIENNDNQQRFFVLDDADKVRDDVFLFHIYNTIKTKNAYLLLTAETYPTEWNLSLKDTKSRLTTINVIKIKQPNEQVIDTILIKMLERRGIEATPQIIKYISDRIERSYSGINRIVNIIDKNLATLNKKITIQNLKHIL